MKHVVNKYRFHPIGETRKSPSKLKRVLACLPSDLSGVAFDVGHRNEFCEELKKKFPALSVSNLLDFEDIDFDLHALPVRIGRMDIVFSFEVIEHLMNPLLHLMSCHSVLRDGGRLYLTTPVGFLPSFLWWGHHFHEYDRKRLLDLVQRAGFRVVQCRKLRYWWRGGILRPVLKMIFGRSYFVEARKILDA